MRVRVSDAYALRADEGNKAKRKHFQTAIWMDRILPDLLVFACVRLFAAEAGIQAGREKDQADHAGTNA